MRMIFVVTAFASLAALSGCGGYGNGGPDNLNEFYPNCDEQAEMARTGRTDGGEIIITCPTPGQPG